MRLKMRLLLALGTIGPCILFAQNTIRVPADKATIQSAILAASNGDTVLVSPGTYKERIDFSKRAITVKSVSGPTVTIVDGAGLGPVVSFTQGENATSVLQGFTIQNGAGGSVGLGQGGGITIEGSSPTIIGNRVVNNNGGGIAILNGAGTQILSNTITGNSSGSDGGGIVLWASGAVLIRDNIITGNTSNGNGGGIATVNAAPATIVDNLIAGNKAGGAGGLSFSNPPLALVNNTIVGNRSSTIGTGRSLERS